MTIRNLEYYVENLWDWTFLDDCFGDTHIKVGDQDGFVERKGKFLVIECKSHDDIIPQGQEIMFNSMIRTGLFTVLVIWGEKNRPERCRLLTKKGEFVYLDADLERIKKIVQEWFRYANGS